MSEVQILIEYDCKCCQDSRQFVNFYDVMANTDYRFECRNTGEEVEISDDTDSQIRRLRNTLVVESVLG